MAKVYIVRTGQTTWETQERVESTAGAPLTPQGERTVQATAERLTKERIGAIYTGTAEPELQTAKLLAKVLDLKVRKNQDLREIDYGLWQGLTLEEIKRRQPKVLKQWNDDPSSVRPPGGETIQEARERLIAALREIIKRRKNDPSLFVLRPIAAALVRCTFEVGRIESMWNYVAPDFNWCMYELDADLLERVVEPAG